VLELLRQHRGHKIAILGLVGVVLAIALLVALFKRKTRDAQNRN